MRNRKESRELAHAVWLESQEILTNKDGDRLTNSRRLQQHIEDYSVVDLIDVVVGLQDLVESYKKFCSAVEMSASIKIRENPDEAFAVVESCLGVLQSEGVTL